MTAIFAIGEISRWRAYKGCLGAGHRPKNVEEKLIEFKSVNDDVKGDVSLFLESDEQQFTKYDYDSKDGSIVPEGSRPSIAVEVMY